MTEIDAFLAIVRCRLAGASASESLLGRLLMVTGNEWLDGILTSRLVEKNRLNAPLGACYHLKSYVN